MRLFHIATLADWEAAVRSGRYTTSTRGRTLADEGFIHASRGDQWQGVRERFYADVEEPLVLLGIDPDRLGCPVVDEPVGPGPETFPHIYGAIVPDAVVQVIALDPTQQPALWSSQQPRSFTSLFLGEMVHRMVLAGIVMVAIAIAVVVGAAIDTTAGPLVGIVVGLVVGVPIAVVVHRRRERRERRERLPGAATP